MPSLSEMKNYDYSPNDIEDELFLSDIPLSLLLETIKIQFENPMEYRKTDYLQTFFNQYYFTKKNMNEEEEDEVEGFYVKFLSFIEDLFQTYLGIGMPNIDDAPEEDQIDLIHYIYRYFIIDIRKNFVNFFFNFIRKNKKKLAKQIEKKKDVTSLSLKKIIEDEDEIAILSNLSQIINMIREESLTIDEFFKYAETESTELEIQFVIDQYDNGNINGNFVEKYMKMIDEDLKVELECKIRNKFLNKYKK